MSSLESSGQGGRQVGEHAQGPNGLQHVHRLPREPDLWLLVSAIEFLNFKPFLPTGQLIAPKIVILMKCLIDVLFFKVLF